MNLIGIVTDLLDFGLSTLETTCKNFHNLRISNLPLETYWVSLEQASWVLGAGCVGFLVV